MFNVAVMLEDSARKVPDRDVRDAALGTRRHRCHPLHQRYDGTAQGCRALPTPTWLSTVRKSGPMSFGLPALR